MNRFAVTILSILALSEVNAVQLTSEVDDSTQDEVSSAVQTLIPQFLATSAEIALALVKSEQEKVQSDLADEISDDDEDDEEQESEDEEEEAEEEELDEAEEEIAEMIAEEEADQEEEVPAVSKTQDGFEVCIPEAKDGCTLTLAVDADKNVIKFTNVPNEEEE